MPELSRFYGLGRSMSARGAGSQVAKRFHKAGPGLTPPPPVRASVFSMSAFQRFSISPTVRRGLVAVLGLLALLLATACFFPQQVLCVDSGEVQGDALVVLGGGSYERPVRAAELFRAGAAPRVIVSGVGDCEGNKRLLVSKGVPAAAIEVEGKSASTKQNAQFSIPLLRALGARRVILVTSWYHSRRALHTFRHYAPDLRFYSRPAYFGYPREQWSRAGISGYIRAEYAKLAGYWVCYGVWPL